MIAGLSTILPLASLFIFFFLPESPVWLVRNGEFEKAVKSLTWLRGGNKKQVSIVQVGMYLRNQNSIYTKCPVNTREECDFSIQISLLC